MPAKKAPGEEGAKGESKGKSDGASKGDGKAEDGQEIAEASRSTPFSMPSNTNTGHYSALYRTRSLQATLDAADIPESSNEPGPGHYFGPGCAGFSSMGPQKFTKCRSEASVGIGKTGWKAWEKVIISKGHSEAFKIKEGEFTTQNDRNPFSSKSVKVGTSLRPDISKFLGVDPNGSPGPVPEYTLYEPPPPRHKDREGQKNFGRGPRFPKDLGASKCGPGQYEVKETLRFDTGRSFSVGNLRPEKVIKNDNWRREGHCQESSGVGDPLWRNPLKDGSQSYTIGREERFRAPRSKSNQVPGPGQYSRTEKDLSNLSCSCSEIRNPINIKFGKMPRKPRFRLGLAQLTSERGCWGYF